MVRQWFIARIIDFAKNVKEGYRKSSVTFKKFKVALSINLLVALLKEMSPYSNMLILSRVDNCSTLVSDGIK